MTQLFEKTRRSPWLTPLVGAGLAAAVMLFPISYDRTTAYDVTLSLDRAQVRPAQIQTIATEMKRTLNAEMINVNSNGGTLTFVARVPAEKSEGLAAVSKAFAGELTARQLTARTSIAPVVTKVQGNVYAMATNRTYNINVQRDGRTDAQIAEDIKNQLHAAGLDVDNVEYQRDGDRETLKVTMEGDAGAHPEGEAADINLTVDGRVPEGERMSVKIHKQPGDTDETIRQRILDQLRAQGVEANVVVRDGKIVSLEPIRH